MTDHPTPGERAAKALMEAGMLFNDDGDQLTVVDRLRLADIAAIIDAHVGGWLPIEELVPTPGMRLDMWHRDGYRVIDCEYRTDYGHPTWFCSAKAWFPEVFTHYQPLPHAPKE